MDIIEISDLLLAFVYVIVLWVLVKLMVRSESKWVKTLVAFGFWAKVFGALAFIGMYLFYFGDGDSFHFFRIARKVWEMGINDPAEGVARFWRDSDKFQLSWVQTKDVSGLGSSEWVFTRIVILLNLISFNNYLCLSFIFMFISFVGSWSLYKFFRAIFPKFHTLFFIGTFFAPSCLFWTTGLIKDTICLTAIELIVWNWYCLLAERPRMRRVFVVVFFGVLLFAIKPYLAVALFVAITFWMFFHFIKRTTDLIIRRMLSFGLGVFIIISVMHVDEFMAQVIWNDTFSYSVDRIQGYHDYRHSGQEAENSNYHLGKVHYTAHGVISKAPKALEVSLLRPYPNESHRPMMIFMSIENLIYMVLFFILLFDRRTWNQMPKIISDQTLIMCLVFVIVLAFIVGLSSYNFGLLMRLRAPYLPFFGAALVIIHYYRNKSSEDVPSRVGL